MNFWDPMGLSPLGKFVTRIGKKTHRGNNPDLRTGELSIDGFSDNITELAEHVINGGDILVKTKSMGDAIVARINELVSGLNRATDIPHGPRQKRHLHPLRKVMGHIYYGTSKAYRRVATRLFVGIATTSVMLNSANAATMKTATKVAQTGAKVGVKGVLKIAGKVALGAVGFAFDAYDAYVIVKTSYDIKAAAKATFDATVQAYKLEQERVELIRTIGDEHLNGLINLILDEQEYFYQRGQSLPPASQVLKNRLEQRIGQSLDLPPKRIVEP